MSAEVILITGASSDIGLALIRRLLSSGTAPTILAHCNSSVDRIEQLRAELTAETLIPLRADFSAPAAVSALAEEISARYGTPSQIVHLPGLALIYERFTKFKWEHFDADLNVQVRAAIILLKRFLPAMAKMPAARVVFLLSSVTRGVPPKYMSMYSIVKHAQLGLMRSLASEYGETGVNINAVSPGMVETRFLANIPEFVKEMSASTSPRKRIATPDEVVHAIEFLLSPGASYINGVELPVTGGLIY